MSDLTTYPLRLPRSIRAGVELMSKRDGTYQPVCQHCSRRKTGHDAR
jgi:hypothetical protein